jgi:hypothetical protein
MKRRRLLEIHEQPWCPPAVRNGATDCLAAIAAGLQQYRGAVPLLAAALQTTGSRRIVDLCSGGAGPWRGLAPALQRRLRGEPLTVLLTDLYPSWRSTDAAPDPLIFVPFPVDATQVAPSLGGFRTLFTAFHHFAPAQAQAILQSAVDAGEGIAIFEQTRRHPLALLVMLVLPLLAWLLTPLIRPWRIERFFWTYVLPAIPAVLCFDGVVSCLRTYTPDELRALAAGLHGPAYDWQAGRVRSPLSPLGVTYLIGAPRGEGVR